MRRVLCGRDFGLFQGTWLGSFESEAMKKEFPEWRLYYSNLERNKGGLLTMVRKTMEKRYSVTQTPLPGAAKGRVLALHLLSKEAPQDPKASFNLVNVYFSSGQSDMAAKAEQIGALAKVDGSCYTVVGGDFNFVEQQADCSGSLDNSKLLGEAKVVWDREVARLRLLDVAQDAHTWFRASDASPSSSRLDRFYTSVSVAESAVIRLKSFPVFAGTAYSRDHTTMHERLVSGAATPLINGLSDHLPVGLDLDQKKAAPKSNRDVPAWAAQVPGFSEAVVVKFGAVDIGANPYAELDRWKEAVREVHSKVVKGKRALADKYGGQVARLTAAVGLLYCCSRARPDHDQVRAVSAAHDYLDGLVQVRALSDDGGFYVTTDLEGYIEKLYGEGVREEAAGLLGEAPGRGLPETFLPGANPKFNYLSSLKAQLPVSRPRLDTLRPSPGALPTAVPGELDAIVAPFYGGVWSRQEGEATLDEIGRYLRDYNKRIKQDLMGEVPGREFVEDVVQSTNDSCAGPDGIAFAFYRADASAGGPVTALLHSILVSLCAGIKGPAGFNRARLFLIAKTDSLLVQDTRPISVTDAANRIIASCLAAALTPALQDFIEPTQKGFVPGRVGTEHVHDLANEFYASLTRKKQLHLLSLDTARAFDSISHNFIRRLLRHIGMPPWVANIVDGLLHEVTVVAAIAGSAATPIRISRGVKQGCPFSPLLFVLCYDVLLWRIAKLDDIRAYGYADDIALTTPKGRTLVNGLGLIRNFSKVSGLGLNMKKTFIVSVFPISMSLRRLLDRRGWKTIREAPSCTYLGVMVGPRVSTREVFAKAMTKFEKRLAGYSPFLRTSSIHTRIVVANVFLLPLLYYLAQFYLVPWDTVVVPVMTALRKMIIPFGGTAFAYAHLITPRAAGGPFVPLRDIWATGMSLLAAAYDLEESDGLPTPAMGVEGHIHWPLTQWRGHAMDRCMAPEGHAAYAAFSFLEDHAPRGDGECIRLDSLPGPNKGPQRRRFVYQTLVHAGYKKQRDCSSKASSLGRKLGRFLAGGAELGRLFVKQAAAVACKLTPAVWNTQLRLMYNALPFDVRRDQANMEPAARPGPLSSSNFPCRFCERGEDSTPHVFGPCTVVRRARGDFATRVGCPVRHGLNYTLLAFPKDPNPAVALSIACFNWAVWTERTQYLPTLAYTPSPEHLARRICDRALRRIPVDRQGTGERAEEAVAALARAPPDSAVIAFTDGSSIPNPGPCGAGLAIRMVGAADYVETAIPLGYGDNNKGEMGAIKGVGEAMEVALTTGQVEPGSDLLIFSDSALCIGFLDHGWAFAKWRQLWQDTRAIYRRLKGQLKVALYWIRGHKGIPGNEMADGIAKRAAQEAADTLERAADARPP